jgi:hypothetical protein
MAYCFEETGLVGVSTLSKSLETFLLPAMDASLESADRIYDFSGVTYGKY